MKYIRQLSGNEVREAIDARDRYQAYRQASEDWHHRYRGTMRYANRNGKQYLLRRRDRSDSSLGPRTNETDIILARFTSEKADLKLRMQGLKTELERRRKLITARGLGRIPSVSARVIRKLDDANLLGTQLLIVGTNALFAYEARAGVQISSDALATEDVDILYDARRNVKLANLEKPKHGLIGLLRDIDKSFAPTQVGSFRAVNKNGFMVDLIEPVRGNPMVQKAGQLSKSKDDLKSVAIKGLSWLVNTPKFNAIIFDENGLPLKMNTVDPRVFALHKLWLSQRSDRDPDKKTRDYLQANVAAKIAHEHLGLDFHSNDLTALPKDLHSMIGQFNFDNADDASTLW